MRASTFAGEKHNRLTALRFIESSSEGQVWKFKCECGTEKHLLSKHVRSGNTKSCGCLNREKIRRPNRRTHGRSFTPEHRAWASIKTRCYNVNSDDYPSYGGRGIKVCEAWLASFEAFFRDMGPRPSAKHYIDRYPDNDGNYEPSNCRWATMKQQSNNRRNSKFIEIDGQKLPLPAAAIVLGINYNTLFWRIKNGRDIGQNAKVIL